MAACLRDGSDATSEVVMIRADGVGVGHLAYPRALRDPAGKIIGALGLLVDISERTSAEVDRERLAAIVSSSNDAIISKTLDGIITSWNEGATRMYGYRADEMLGKPVTLLMPEEIRAEEEEILARLRQGEVIEHFDTVRLTNDGRRIDVSLAISPVRDGTGRIVGASKVARDISERKRARGDAAAAGRRAQSPGQEHPCHHPGDRQPVTAAGTRPVGLRHQLQRTGAGAGAGARPARRGQAPGHRRRPARPGTGTPRSDGGEGRGDRAGRPARAARGGATRPRPPRARDQRPQARGTVAAGGPCPDRMEPRRSTASAASCCRG